MLDEYVLPFRPAPNLDESLLGYIQRLAEANACESSLRITDRVGLDLPKAAFAGDLSHLARICGREDVVLQKMSYETTEAMVSFRGHALRRERIRNGFGKICGLCLAEVGYRRASWDLAFGTICAVHKVYLVGKCQECSGKLHWSVASSTRCRCGADLTRQVGASASEDNADAVATAISLLSGSEPSSLGFSNELRGILPGNLIELALFLGRNANAFRLGGQNGGRASSQNLVPALRTGLEFCRGWPEKFHELLTDLLRSHAGGSSLAGNSPLGRFYQLVSGLPDADWTAPIQREFREFAWRNQSVFNAGRSQLFEGLPKQKGYIDLKLAALKCRVNDRHLFRLLKIPGAAIIRHVGDYERRMFVHEEDVKRFGDVLRDALDSEKLGKLLGIERRESVAMIRNGGVFRYWQWASDGDYSASTSKGDVMSFLERQETNAKYSCGRPERAITFDRCVEQAGRFGMKIAEVLRLMVADELKAVGIVEDRIGVHRFLFDGQVFRSLLESYAERKTGAASVARATAMLNMRPSTVYGLIEAGLLTAKEHRSLSKPDIPEWLPPATRPERMSRHWRAEIFDSRIPPGLRVPLQDLAAYASTYIDLPGICRDTGGDRRLVLKALKARDILPVVKAGDRGTGIYRRAEIVLAGFNLTAPNLEQFVPNEPMQAAMLAS